MAPLDLASYRALGRLSTAGLAEALARDPRAFVEQLLRLPRRARARATAVLEVAIDLVGRHVVATAMSGRAGA
jgi:hypothetical protein